MALSALPGSLPEYYDKITAAGVPSPGVVRVQEVAREYVWDLKQAPGAAGENMTFKGLKNVQFSLEFQLLGDAQLEEWEAWITLWDFDPTKSAPQPLNVQHPLLEERAVTIVTAKKIYAPKQSRPGDNLWIAKIEAVEWRPPPKANVAKSPSSAKSGGSESAAGGPPAETARQREIRELTQQFKDA